MYSYQIVNFRPAIEVRLEQKQCMDYRNAYICPGFAMVLSIKSHRGITHIIRIVILTKNNGDLVLQQSKPSLNNHLLYLRCLSSEGNKGIVSRDLYYSFWHHLKSLNQDMKGKITFVFHRLLLF
jgi:hypothetical protein